MPPRDPAAPPIGDLCAAIEHPVLARLFADWCAWCGARDMPSRRDFTPEMIAYALGRVVVLDVQHAPLRFRYRLVGTNTVVERGYEVTGRFLDEHPGPSFVEITLPICTRVVAERRPAHNWFDFHTHDGQVVPHEAIVLPLADQDGAIDMLMACQQPRG